MKTVSILIALSLFASAAYANDGGLTQRGTSQVGAFTGNGIPIVLPWVSDRTYRRYGSRPNWQPGPFRDVRNGE